MNSVDARLCPFWNIRILLISECIPVLFTDHLAITFIELRSTRSLMGKDLSWLIGCQRRTPDLCCILPAHGATRRSSDWGTAICSSVLARFGTVQPSTEFLNFF